MKIFYPHSNKVLQSSSLTLLKNRNLRRYLFRLSLPIIIFCFSNSAYAQSAPPIQWQKSLGGSFADEAYSVQQTTDGGFIVGGNSYSTDGDVTGNHGIYDYWIVKLDANGNIVWQKSLGGSGADYVASIKQTTDGGFIIAGYSDSNDGDVSGHHGASGLNGTLDYWIVKIDSNGNIIWQKSLGGSGDDFGESVQQTTDGGYIIAGGSKSNDGDITGNHSSDDYWIVKLDASGNILWEKSLGGSDNDYAYSIQQTSEGGFIVGGSSLSTNGDVTGNHGSEDYWIVKLDASGDIMWEKSLGGSDNDYANSIQQTTDGGFIVSGYSPSTNGDVTGNPGSLDYWVVKLDANGNLVWEKSLGGTSEEFAYSIQQTVDGGFIVAGASVSNDGDVSGNHGDADDWIVKLDPNGNLVWEKSLGGSGFDQATSIGQTTDGGFIIAGSSGSNDGDVSGNHGFDDY